MVNTSVITETSERMFALDTYYVFITPNPEMFRSDKHTTFTDFCPEADPIFRIYVPSTGDTIKGFGRERIASGLIITGLVFAVRSNQVLYLDKN